MDMFAGLLAVDTGAGTHSQSRMSRFCHRMTRRRERHKGAPTTYINSRLRKQLRSCLDHTKHPIINPIRRQARTGRERVIAGMVCGATGPTPAHREQVTEERGEVPPVHRGR